VEPSGFESCPARWATSRKRVLRGRRRRRLRSVHSERAGRVMEPRNGTYRGCRRCTEGGRQHRSAKSRATPEWLGDADPPGSESRACTGGRPRNLGDPDASPALSRGTTERSASERSRGVGKSERRSTSDEAGEPTRGTLPSKGRRRIPALRPHWSAASADVNGSAACCTSTTVRPREPARIEYRDNTPSRKRRAMSRRASASRQLPNARRRGSATLGGIERRSRLGGVLNSYRRAA
jgi:hypothetical protein